MIDFACRRFDLNEVIKCSLALTKSDYRILQLLLSESSEYLSSEEISNKIKVDISTAQRSLKKLRSKELVTRKQINLSPGGYVFIYKAKDNLAIKKMILDIVNSWTHKVESELEKWRP